MTDIDLPVCWGELHWWCGRQVQWKNLLPPSPPNEWKEVSETAWLNFTQQVEDAISRFDFSVQKILLITKVSGWSTLVLQVASVVGVYLYLEWSLNHGLVIGGGMMGIALFHVMVQRRLYQCFQNSTETLKTTIEQSFFEMTPETDFLVSLQSHHRMDGAPVQCFFYIIEIVLDGASEEVEGGLLKIDEEEVENSSIINPELELSMKTNTTTTDNNDNNNIKKTSPNFLARVYRRIASKEEHIPQLRLNSIA